MSDDAEHLANLSDGAGCTEIWEHLSEQRAAAAEAADDSAESSADAEGDDDAETAEDDAPEKDAAVEVPCP